MKIGIVVSEFNYDITMMMLERAKEHAKFLGAEVCEVVKVPGVFDMPLDVKRLVQKDGVDGVATLGAVIEGETEHDDVVIQQAARKITDLSVEYNKPIGLGITGVVTVFGHVYVNSGSTTADAGRRKGLSVLTLISFCVSVSTAACDTSLPVPAVVGTHNNGSTGPGTLSKPK